MNAYPASADLNPNDRKRKSVVFSENGRRYEYVNTAGTDVTMIHVDGGLFSENTAQLRCDYAFETVLADKTRTCLIELKGHDIPYACLQLKESVRYFETHYPTEKFYCRLVTSGNKKPNRESIQEKELNAYLLKNGYQRLKTGTNSVRDTSEDLT